MRLIVLCCALAFAPVLWADTAPSASDPQPSFTKDIKPFLNTYCQGCHSGKRAKGGYNVDSFAALTKNGRRGPLVVPGKPDDSRMTLCLDGKGKPMPPKKADQPTADEKAKVRAWIQAGAIEDKEPDDKKGQVDKP
jgi:mono/diheme cytochrome c family protein